MDELQYIFNGKIFTSTQLQEKYGDSWESAAAERGIEKAYQYQDKVFSQSQLKDKYGDDYENIISEKGITPLGSVKGSETPDVEKKNQVGTDSPLGDGSLDLQKLDKAFGPQPEHPAKPFLPKDVQEMLPKDDDLRDMVPKGDSGIDKLTLTTPEAIEAQENKQDYWYAVLKSGLSTFNEALASPGEALYRIGGLPGNLIAQAADLPEDHWLRTSPEKFKEYSGTTNPVLDYYKAETEELGAKKLEYQTKAFPSSIEKDDAGIPQRASAWKAFKSGDYADGFALIGTGTLESAPTSLAIMASGGAFGLPATASGTTIALFEQNVQNIRQQNPDMSEAEVTWRGFLSSAAESVFETVTAGTTGQIYKDLIKKEGVEAGTKIFKEGLNTTLKGLLKKYGALAGSVTEGVQEAITQITQNLLANQPVMDGVVDAFLIGVGSGAAMTAPINVANQLEKSAQPKSPEGGAQELNIPAITPDRLQDMTQDESGDYVFFHKSNENLETIDPYKMGTKGSATSKQEISDLSKGGSVAFFYTQEEDSESMVRGKNKYAVKVDPQEVYDFNLDPNNYNEKGKELFEEEFPGQGYNPTVQLGYVARLAGQQGYKMVVSAWEGKTRAVSTQHLEPSDVESLEGQAITKGFDQKYNKVTPPKETAPGVTFRGKEWQQAAQEALPEAPYTKEEITEIMEDKGKDFGFLTAENPNAKQATDEVNAKNQQKAMEWLKKRGYNPVQVLGKYGIAENSIFVEDLTVEDAHTFSKTFAQESVAHSKGFIKKDGTVQPKTEVATDKKDAFDNYTTFKTKEGEAFNVALDYDFKAKPLSIEDVSQTEEIVDEAKKPELKMSFPTLTEIRKSEQGDQILKSRETIKEEFKDIKKIMDCLWKS